MRYKTLSCYANVRRKSETCVRSHSGNWILLHFDLLLSCACDVCECDDAHQELTYVYIFYDWNKYQYNIRNIVNTFQLKSQSRMIRMNKTRMNKSNSSRILYVCVWVPVMLMKFEQRAISRYDGMHTTEHWLREQQCRSGRVKIAIMFNACQFNARDHHNIFV